MKKIVQVLGVFTFFFLFSCGEDYLKTEPTEQISGEQLRKNLALNPDLLEANIRGLYSLMVEVGSGRSFYRLRDDFGQKSYDIFSDILCADMAVANGNNYRQITNYSATENNTLDGSRKTWTYYFRVIKSANQIIDILKSVGESDNKEENQKRKYLLGQAKTIRAHAYFYLLSFYTNYDESEKILPLYKNGKQVNQPQTNTKEIFDFVMSDLTDAVKLLGDFKRSKKNQINQNVAKGMLAYVYGARGNYQKVFDLTSEIIASNEFVQMDSAEVLGGFNNINTKGWMWGFDIVAANNLSRSSFWGQVDIFHNGDAYLGDFKSIDDGLYAKIKAEDVRKKQFNADTSKYYLAPTSKFYDSKRKEGGKGVTDSDYVFMRISEMILLNAEAATRLGNDPKAKEVLKQFLSKRLTANSLGYIDGLSGQLLKNEIYLQTRIEFWGEGKSYLAMKRNKATITRGNNHLFFKNKSLKYDNTLLIFKIPSDEITNNPNIK